MYYVKDVFQPNKKLLKYLDDKEHELNEDDNYAFKSDNHIRAEEDGP